MKPYISLPESVPGMRSLLTAYPETGQYLGSLAQQLLRGESSLTPAERELIAARVSLANDCAYCKSSHAATASDLFPEDKKFIVKKLSKTRMTKYYLKKCKP
jgi:alkylhydroperoxidase family enzyme